MKKLLILFLFLTLKSNLYSQTKFIPDYIVEYTNNISLAVANNNKGNLDAATQYFKLANKVTPIHIWDLMYVRNLLKKQFDKDLFLICVREEFIQKGFSSTLNDTSFSNKITAKDLNKIKGKTTGYQLEYLKGVNKDIENKLQQIEALDQFTRDCDIGYLFECDTCIIYRKRLVKYVDTAYTIPLIKFISEQPNLTYRSFGNSHFAFILILRHALNTQSKDTSANQLWVDYAHKLVNDFIITPQYYASLTDYCFNFKLDENHKILPIHNYGEHRFHNKLVIDNPEETDKKRVEIGLLPLWESVSFPSLLPENYVLWHESLNKKEK